MRRANMLFTYILFFLFLFFEGGVASESDSDMCEEELLPAAKKLKLSKVVQTNAPGKDRNRGRGILCALKAAGEEGCSDQDIKNLLHHTKRGKQSIKEAIVTLMFNRAVVITHDVLESRFWYKGLAYAKTDAPDIRLALASHMAHTPCDCPILIADIGDAVLQKGCYSRSYYAFERLFYAVSAIFQRSATDLEITMRDFWRFVKTEREKCTLACGLIQKYEAQGRGLSKKERLIAQIMLEIPKEIYDQIDYMRQAQGAALQKACDHLGKHPPPQRHMALVLAETMYYGRCVDFHKICILDKPWIRFCPYEDLRKIYNAVCVMCCEEKTILQAQALHFLGYVQKKMWPESVTFLEQKQAYCQGESGPFDIKLWETVEYILSLPQDVSKQLQSIKIPIKNRLPQKKQEVESNLLAEMKRCATNGEIKPHNSMAHFVPSKWKGHLEVLKRTFDTAFKHNMAVFYDAQCNFHFSFARTDMVEVLVPMEIFIAARFCGMTCLPKDKVHFANTLYCAGCPIKSYDDYSDTFDAVCVLHKINTTGSQYLEQAKGFFEYIKNAKKTESLQECVRAYRPQGQVSEKAMSIVLQALDIERTGVFTLWEFSSQKDNSVDLTLKVTQCWEKIGRLTMRILQEYAQQSKACSYKIFRMFLPNLSSEKEVAGIVLDIALRRKTPIIYDRNLGVFSLSEGPDIAPKPPGLMKAFILKNLCKNEDLDNIDLAYDLYEAGYPLTSLQEVMDLREIYTQLACQDAKYMLQHTQGLVYYMLRNKKREGLSLLDGTDSKFSSFDEKERRFCASLLRLYSSKGIDIADINRLFTQQDHVMSWDRGGMEKDAYASQDIRQDGDQTDSAHVPTDLEIAENSQEHRGMTQTPAGHDTQEVQAGLAKATGGDFHSVVLCSVQEKAVLRYADIVPYAKGAQTPEEVLEFVLDFVFKNAMCVQYDETQGEYTFLLQPPHQGERSRAEELMSYMEAYEGQECTVRDRAACAYAMHVRGARYTSFQDFAQDFGSVCMVKDIGVQGMEDVARSKAFWNDMQALPGEPNDADMFHRAMNMVLFAGFC